MPQMCFQFTSVKPIDGIIIYKNIGHPIRGPVSSDLPDHLVLLQCDPVDRLWHQSAPARIIASIQWKRHDQALVSLAGIAGIR